ncbi:MAG: outer membrane insertion C- signal [Reichenbachiella sp.]
MKRVILLMLFVCLGVVGAQAQSANEIGIRFGDAAGNNIAVDGLIGIGEFSRIHADVSFGSGVGIDLLWDFLYKPVSDTPFDWYVGAGPSLFIGDPFLLGVSGEVGMEYTFDFPMSLSFDYRPTFWIIEDTKFGNGFGFNVRYVFGE